MNYASEHEFFKDEIILSPFGSSAATSPASGGRLFNLKNNSADSPPKSGRSGNVIDGDDSSFQCFLIFTYPLRARISKYEARHFDMALKTLFVMRVYNTSTKKKITIFLADKDGEKENISEIYHGT